MTAAKGRGNSAVTAGGSTATRYGAFISYSHLDRRTARQLHRRLERYRIPRKIAGSDGERGTIPDRLGRIFRDLDELPAADDLSAEVRAALAVSDSLIVICSPAAAASQWVAREIELFRELNPGRPVLAALIDGEPATSIPAPLWQSSRGDAIEPLAADFRHGRDGDRLGLLKLVAGVVGVPLDALVQRDAQARLRGVMAITLLAFAAVLVMAALTIVALGARREAEHQREEAERLVDFMQVQLRTKLKEVGRLDAMSETNEAMLGYYGRQSLDTLPPESILRLANALHARGEDDLNRDDLAEAGEKFARAYDLSARLLAAAPDDADRIFTHAQSEFWLGHLEYSRRRTAEAEARWQRYAALAGQLLAVEPGSPRALQQTAFADGNLCTIAMEQPTDLHAALRWCTRALERMEQAARAAGNGSFDIDLVNRHLWLAGIYAEMGDRVSEARHLSAQERLLRPILLRTPLNLDCQDMWLVLQMSIARHEIALGRPAEARVRLAEAGQRAEMMALFDPANKRWARLKQTIAKLQTSISN
jgi:tetratricopeptide (TPR) repeat protein